MKSIKTSVQDLNRPHPLVGAVIAGLLGVALSALFVPGGLETPDAWRTFLVIGTGAGLGLLIHARGRPSVDEDHG